MREHEIDRLAAQIGGAPQPETLLERAVDRLAAVLAGSFGTRSWQA